MQDDFKNQLPDIEPRVVTPAEKRWRFFLGVISAIVLVAVVYIFVLRYSFIYQRTPERIQQPEVESVLDAEIATVPLTIFIFTGEEGYGSERDDANARRTVANAANIWKQANIELVIKDIFIQEITSDELETLHYKPGVFVESIDHISNTAINVFFVKRLQGSNGISYGGLQSIAIADYTTVYDFRALAHEIGHQLGLTHVLDDSIHLMSQGVNGFDLDDDEIMTAREYAEQFDA